MQSIPQARSLAPTETLLLVYSLPGLSSMARPPSSSCSPSSHLTRAGFGADCACEATVWREASRRANKTTVSGLKLT